jgi:hypothetical protein
MSEYFDRAENDIRPFKTFDQTPPYCIPRLDFEAMLHFFSIFLHLSLSGPNIGIYFD